MLEFTHHNGEAIRVGVRAQFPMTRYTLIAPDASGINPELHADRIREAFNREALNWTEYPTVGYWNGIREPGTLFELYYADGLGDTGLFGEHLAHIGRVAMPDEQAVQVTVDPHLTTILEG